MKKFVMTRLWHDRDAAVLVLMALLIIPLLGFAGLALDSARGYLLNSRLTGALDAAGLAGGRVMLSPDDERDADINRFFDANFTPGFMNATLSTLSIETDAGNKVLTLTREATINTTFMQVFGIPSMTVSARTVIRRETRGLELVMVLDTTGSMCIPNCAKLDAMKEAARDLVDILYGDDETIPNFWVALVPFVHSVNVGNQHADWLVQAPPGPPAHPHVDITACNNNPTNVNICQQAPLDFYHPSYYDPAPNYAPANIPWKGCVEARLRPDDGSDQNDDPPSVRLFRPYFFPETRVRRSLRRGRLSSPVDNAWYPNVDELDNDWRNDNGPNIGCGPPIQPLVAGKTGIMDAIDDLEAWRFGGTAIKLGLAWGWRAISPRWKGLWGDPNLPLDYDAPLTDKVIIVLTDGVQQYYNRQNFPGADPGDYTSHGRRNWDRMGLGTTSETAHRTEMNNRLATVCASVKNGGVLLYTIMFQENNGTLQNLFRDCATSPDHFFLAPTNEELREVFRTIGNDLNNLRIAE